MSTGSGMSDVMIMTGCPVILKGCCDVDRVLNV